MDDLRLPGGDGRVLFVEQRDDSKLTVRIRAPRKNLGTVLSHADEDKLRDFLNERHADRS